MNAKQEQRVKTIMLKNLKAEIKKCDRQIARGDRKVVRLQAKHDRLQARLINRIQNDTLRIANI